MRCPAPFQALLPETKMFEHRPETFADVCPQNGACSRGFILELGSGVFVIPSCLRSHFPIRESVLPLCAKAITKGEKHKKTSTVKTNNISNSGKLRTLSLVFLSSFPVP